MARGGRPVERPAHLSQQQRLHAKDRTRAWRQLAGLSQSQMAAELHLSQATYRGWENTRDEHGGPTRAQAETLNEVLLRLLPGQYSDGEAFDVWGWPRKQKMSYEQVADLLHFAGFSVPWPQATVKSPVQVFWPHKVRKAHLVHGTYALAAAAATRAGLPVRLLLDDTELEERDRHQCDELEFWVRNWVAFASGDDARISVGRYSSILDDEFLAVHTWPALSRYLNKHSSVLRFLLASKVVSPLRYSADQDDGVLELQRDREHIRADRLLTPLRNWLVFESEVTRLLGRHSHGGDGTIITLGGDDELDLWEMWHRGCSEDLSERVQHMYLTAMPVPERTDVWTVPALAVSTTDRLKLASYLRNNARSAGSDLIEWLLRAAVHLPARLSPGFQAVVDPALRDVPALLESSDTGLITAPLVEPIARAVTTWLTGSYQMRAQP